MDSNSPYILTNLRAFRVFTLRSNCGRLVSFFALQTNKTHFLLGILLSGVNIFLILTIAPQNQLQADFGNIFYIHVPVAWTAFIGYLFVMVFSILFLWKKEQIWDHYALASAEAGTLFMFLVLLTGPIWAKPAWGHFWVWEPRLTTSLILFLIFLGYFMLREFGGNPEQVSRYAAVLGIIAFIDVPIIFLSVKLWLPELQSHPQVGQYFINAGIMPSLMINYSLLSLLVIISFMIRFRVHILKRLEERNII